MAIHTSAATIFLLTTSLLFTTSSGLSEIEALMEFKNSLASGAPALATWDPKNPPCNENRANWVGVMCHNGTVWGLRLEKMGLSGTISVDFLKDLPHLRTLSFMNNRLEGSMPSLEELRSLKSLYLSNNQFAGVIPRDTFKGMTRLKKVLLENNRFTGPIPAFLTTLPRLLEVRLDGNQFSGLIPDIKHKPRMLNLSNNNLEGPIPEALSTMDPEIFAGNKALCGKPLQNECKTVPAPEQENPGEEFKTPPERENPDEEAKTFSTKVVVVAVVVAAAAVVLIILTVFIISRRNKSSHNIEATPSPFQRKTRIRDSNTDGSARPVDRNSGSHALRKSGPVAAELSFLRDDRQQFNLPDLLKASAEILGSGCFGSSYKAALANGLTMVVKRFKQMNNLGREEFQEHMRRLGRLHHRNLLPIIAYYYRKEEKLLLCDFVAKGSLAVNLHGHQSLGQPSLDWPTRLKIVKGIARGLQYLHKELPSLIVPHGHIKSSNVLLGQDLEPLLTDYGLIPVINQENAQELMVAYKSPEYLQHGRVTKKTDIWGLGILILEVLTGKFPANFLPKGGGNEEEDLAAWVSSVFQGEWSDELFDKEMGKTSGSEGEIVKLLKVGLGCCKSDVEKRFDIKDAVERIEEVKERDGDDDFYSTYASEADHRSSKGTSGEFGNL